MALKLTPEEFAEEHGMSVEAAAETIAKYEADPGAEEFKPVRAEMEEATGITAPPRAEPSILAPAPALTLAPPTAVLRVPTVVEPTPPVERPTLKPAITGTPIGITRTSDLDKFIVRTQLKDAPAGEYLQETLSRSQVEARGGFIPPRGVSIADVGSFAEEYGMSERAAAETLEKFQQYPTSPEFAPLTTKEKEVLLKIAKPKDVQLVEVVKGQPMLLVETAALEKLAGIRDPEEHFLAMQSLRLVPESAEYDPISKGYFPLEQVEIRKAFETELKKQPQVLRDAYKKGGIEAYNKEVAKQVEEFETELKVASPSLYQIYNKEGYDTYMKAFEDSHIKLPDGKWINKEDFNVLPNRYQSIGKKNGFDAILVAIEADKTRQDTIVATLDKKYQIDGGYNLPLALKDKAVTESDLDFVGFEKPSVVRAVSAVKASIDTNIAVAGERNWLNIRTGKVYTDSEYKKLVQDFESQRDTLVKAGKMYSPEWDKLGTHPENETALAPASARRLGVQLVSFIAPATRAALPEYTIKDISAVEWGLTGVNVALIGTAFAPGAIMASLAGKGIITGVSATGAGFLGYNTAKNWADLSPVQRTIGVAGTILYALPLMITVGRGVKISSVKIPAIEGQAVSPPTWKGLSVFKNPVIGKSGGKWVIGARDITLPEAKLIMDGYKPELTLDTKVFANPTVLAKAGFSQTQIKYLSDSLKARNLFAGKKVPYLAKDVLLQPTAYIDGDEMAVFLRQIGRYNTKVKNVDMLYGGTTIRAQLASELRGWRQIHDLDMHTTFTLQEAQKFVNETLAILKRLPSKHQYRISPTSPLRIEKLVQGKWEHMNDLKSAFIDPKLQISEVAVSKLDTTGTYSYGRLVAEPAITVKYPGIGKIDIMTLSESGVRKADTILRVRQTEIGTAFRPPARGIAAPGVPKDAADFYVILQTFEKGGILKLGIADDWLASWAKAMGYTEAQLPKLFPNLKKAAIEVASNSPSNLTGYRFTPASSAKVSVGATPTIAIQVPSSLGASVSASLARKISTPVSLYALSSTARASISSTVAEAVPSGYPTMVSISTMKGLSPSEKANISASVQRISPKVSPQPSPAPSPLISPQLVSVKPFPSPSPKPSPIPSPKPSPIPPSPKPSPGPIPPSPKPSPVLPLVPEPVPGKPPLPVILPKKKVEPKIAEVRVGKGAICWRQGLWWYKIVAPYKKKSDVSRSKHPPLGTEVVKGSRSAYKTIQLLYGRAPSWLLTLDMGIQDIIIDKPTRKAGRKSAIKFKKDRYQRTKSMISLAGVRE